ncbi:V-type ATP synthase subunit H [Caloramator mitchellensis]|uniref:V-type ATP synthase subunit H n=1 Tax=Caloramator mitchellensis TaxID=908809 RepID=A0A0R3K1D3_CALMK|nr:V-type ATPase subunit subunit G family protein [Caloramator mitchellensis]KRQ87326.1 V-type ATP synthase subunit H [Caloramator mitchellensis]
MALEVVRQVSEIERQSEEIVKQSQLKATEIIKNAKEQADNIIKDAHKRANIMHDEILSKYENEGQVEANPIIEEGNKSIEQVKNVPPDKLDKAVNMVIERIVNSHGDS